MRVNETIVDQDDLARRTALDVERSFIVQAPAGSGKTELLIQRFLALLGRVQRPEAIVAMTFTRKAAGEMLERIVAALRAAETEPPPLASHHARTWNLARAALERDAALGWNLTAHPARLQVQTIDALCANLMRQAPLAAKVGALPQFIENARSMYVEAARLELDATADDPAWVRLLAHLDNDANRAVELIAHLLGKREQWLPFLLAEDRATLRDALEQMLIEGIEAELRAVHAAIPASLVASLLALARYAVQNLEGNGVSAAFAACANAGKLPAPTVDSMAQWQALADWLLRSGDPKFRGSVDIRNGFPARGRPAALGYADRAARKDAMHDLLESLAAVHGLGSALGRVRTLPPPRYADESWSFIGALLDILPRCVARLAIVFSSTGTIDFAEATLIALRALGDADAPTDLMLSLDMRIEHLLVDEFQDTSHAHFELIESLTAGWTGDDGRTLFVVGDPMQSIYRFREAEVSLFLSACEEGRIGSMRVEPLTLSRNFRSQRNLVEWVNRVFPHVLPAQDDAARGAVAFKCATAARDAASGAAVSLDICSDMQYEARSVVARVREALASGAETVAVLVRKRADLTDILPALRAAGVAFSAVDLDRLSERQAMLDLLSLAHALVQPDDRLAWLTVLRAPWCGLTLPDLFAVASACSGETLAEAVDADIDTSELSDDGKLRLQRFASVVAPALRNRGRMPLHALVRGVWIALGGPACIAESIDLAGARCFFALLGERAAGADVPDWPAFVQAFEAIHAEDEPDLLARVRLMTLHRAKGLEFDVVVMPGLGRRPGKNEPQLLRWRRRRNGWLLAPIKARNIGPGEDDPVHAYLRRLAADEDEAELGRLLYVGCTRARQRVHLTAVLASERGDGPQHRWKPPAKGTALAKLWEPLHEAGSVPPHPGTVPVARTRVDGVPLPRLPLEWRAPVLPDPLAITPAVPIASSQESVEFDWARETARQIGIVAHRVLHRIADEGLDAWSESRIESHRKQIARELAAVAFTADEVSGAVEQVVAAITATLSDSRGRWLFAPTHLHANSECALTAWLDGQFKHIVIDRTFVDDQNVRWIVDFKLSRHEGGDRAAFLDRERERYRAQLEMYAQAMRAMETRPIRLGLYFPLLGGWREWE